MDEVYIVTKKAPLETEDGIFDISFNEAVFSTEDAAKEYIKARKKLKDRDDIGCTFHIEPWHVQ